MGQRDHYPDPQGHRGVETVLFNSTGFKLGKIGPDNFERQWGRIRDTVYRGTLPHYWSQSIPYHVPLKQVAELRL